MPAIDQLLVSCADIALSRAFFADVLGLVPGTLRSAPPPLPGDRRALRAECVIDSACAPGDSDTQLHLVQYETPGSAVRDGAGRHDACPKTINFLCRDLPDLYSRLAARGLRFASSWVEYEKLGVHYRDVHLAGPDAQNIGLLEIPGEDYPVNDRGVGPVAAVCFTLQHMAEADAAAAALALPLAFDETLAGAAVETLVGLPRGAALVMRLFGSDRPRGRFEFVEYRGATGVNRYPRARPPATGLLHPRIRISDRVASGLATAADSELLRIGTACSGELLGRRACCRSLETRGGLRIELVAGA